jgi:hydroxyethylthiazole kinase-like uncharacterized protein yjeF
MVEYVKLVGGREMAEIDRRTISERGIPGSELIERAARAVFEAVEAQWEGLDGIAVVVVCGKGNNGGDGFAIARLLREAGVATRVFLAAERAAVDGDAALHLQQFEETGGQVEVLVDEAGLGELSAALKQADLVVDALLGTGLRGAPRPTAGEIIKCIVQSRLPVVAVDLPSGLDADTGQVHGPCIRAVLTVTFGLPKCGHIFYPGRSHCGVLHLVDIGFPPEIIAESPVETYLLTAESMAPLIPRRSEDAHKGTCGTVVVVAGSAGMTGAAALTADTALMAGAGRVTLGAPVSLNDILEIKLTEVMTWPLPEIKKHRCLALRSMGEILALCEHSNCLALGPGLGRHPETAELVRRLVSRVEKCLVVDADGLNALAAATDILKERSMPLVLTPHIGEFVRLTGLDKQLILENPREQARRFAQEYGLTLVLKGAPTLVATADGRVLVNSTGNAGMATAGSGDVLTGLIAGLIAQGVEPVEAACLGVFLHGRAGDWVRDQQGEWGMKAGDISRAVPRTILAVYSTT